MYTNEERIRNVPRIERETAFFYLENLDDNAKNILKQLFAREKEHEKLVKGLR